MFYTDRVLFVHVPRTGGTWLTEYAHEMFRASIDIHWLKHASLERIHQAIPETAPLIPFTITRDVGEIEESTWKLLTSPASEVEASYWRWMKDVVRQLGREAFFASEHNILRDPFFLTDIVEFAYEKPHSSVVAWLYLMHQEPSPCVPPTSTKELSSP